MVFNNQDWHLKKAEFFIKTYGKTYTDGSKTKENIVDYAAVILDAIYQMKILTLWILHTRELKVQKNKHYRCQEWPKSGYIPIIKRAINLEWKRRWETSTSKLDNIKPHFGK